MIITSHHLTPNLVNSTLRIARAIAAQESLRSQKRSVCNTDRRPGCNNLIGRCRLGPISRIADRCTRCCAADGYALRLKIIASLRTKRRQEDLASKGQIHNCSWHVGIHTGAVAQLSVGVCSKAPDGSIVLHGNAVRAGAHGNRSAKIAHYRGCAAVRVGPIAKLTTAVLPPSHHRPIAFNRQRMILARGDRNGVGDSNGLHGGQAPRGCSITKLAKSIIAPVPHCAISL